MVSYNLILIFSSISVIQSLKCPSCEFKLKLGDSFPNQPSCAIQEDDIDLCKGYIAIDYLTESIYIWLNPINKESVKDIASSLDIPLPLNRIQKSLIKYQFDMTFQSDESFTIGAVFFCQSNDNCIIEETQRLLSQLNALKYVSRKIRKELENLLIKSSSDNSESESTVMCFHSFSNRIIECTSSNDPTCFIGIRDRSSDIVAGCARNPEKLFVTVSYYVVNPISNIKGEKSSCGIHCNQDNCNTQEVYNKVINIVQKYILRPRQ